MGLLLSAGEVLSPPVYRRGSLLVSADGEVTIRTVGLSDTALQLLARAGVERVLIGALQGHLPVAQRTPDSRDWEVDAR